MPSSNYRLNHNLTIPVSDKKAEQTKKTSVDTSKKYVKIANKHKNNNQDIPLAKRNIKSSSKKSSTVKTKQIKQNNAVTDSTASIDKNHEDGKDLAEGLANLPPIAEVIRQEQTWKALRADFYPDLGNTPEEEKAIFLKSLEKVTRGLDGQEKSKAVLMHVLERFKATGFTYGHDIDSEGVRDVASSVAETLADRGQDIDCEDFSIVADFWLKSAIEAGYLPEGSRSFVLVGHDSERFGHAVTVFQSPEGDHYILDGTMGVKFYTLNEYREVSTYLDYLEGEYEYNPLNYGADKLDYRRWISEEKLNYESDSPLDKSISDIDLKKKIYAQHDVAVDPSSPAQSIHDYYDSLLQYTHLEFAENKLEYTLENPMALLPNAGSAIAEGTIATVFALYKRHKLMRRRSNIVAANNVQTKLNKHPSQYQNTTVNLARFKDLSHVSFLIENNNANKSIIPLAQVLNCHKSYQTTDDFNKLINNLITVFPDDNNLQDIKNNINEEAISNPKKLADIQKKLKKYGITIEYQKIGSLKQQIPDKFRKKKNEKLQACMHKTVIDKKIFYKQLKQENKLPDSKVIDEVVKQHNETITTLNKLKNYDDWKLNFITKDASLKVGAATAGVIPIIPVDELVRTGAYVAEEKYRVRNKANMQYRITTSLNMLKQQKNCFNAEQYQELESCLKNVQEMKTRHIGLKENKVRRMQAIHLTAAAATPLTDIAGPIGTGIRSGAKGVAKVANSVYPAVRRYQGDKLQKQRQAFNTSSDVYEIYKNLYIEAKQNNNLAQQNAILHLADESFDLEPYEFEALIDTSLIENKQFKLSFSRPIGYKARIPYYIQDTKL